MSELGSRGSLEANTGPLADRPGAGARFGVYLSDLAKSRQVRRLRHMVEAFGADAMCLIRPPKSPTPSRIDDLASELRLQVVTPPETERGGREVPGKALDAVLFLADPPPAGVPPAIHSRHGTWAVVDGDPSEKCGPSAIGQAIAAGRRHVGVTVRQVRAGTGDWPVLAFCQTPRRAWDRLEDLQQRLDAYLPLLIEEALVQARQGRVAHITASGGADRPAIASRFNLAQRLRDAAFAAHVAGKALSACPRDAGTRIICLHNPASDILDDFLTQFGRLSPLMGYSDTVAALRQGRPLEPGVVVTFDDGYKQNLAFLDVLERHRCKAMFFISTRIVDSNDGFWFMDKHSGSVRPKSDFRKMSYRSFLAESVVSPLPSQMRFGLTSAEIRMLVAKGHEVGVHTHNHPFLSNEGVDVRYEIGKCYDRLREILTDESLPLHIAYPDGDHSDHVVATARDMGAVSAATTQRAPLGRASDPLRLPRYVLGDNDYPGAALLKMTRMYGLLKTPSRSRSA